jgi:dTDP-4-dehydrorhamnose 3,5-epimerase
MKIIQVKTLKIKDVIIIRFARFCDHRGYFTEHYRRSDLSNNNATSFLKNINFVQANESFSKKGTIRGLHFQWNPYMGKIVRTLEGRMIDIVLDIRKESPTFGKVILYDMPANRERDYSEWIWVPPGFAHGNLFPEDTLIEYFCTGEYSQGCEAGISPLAQDIDWSLCDLELRRLFERMASTTQLITEKDKNGLTVKAWNIDERSNNFIYGNI